MTGQTRPVSRVLMTVDAVGGVWRYAMDLAAALSAVDVSVIFAGFGPKPSDEQMREAQALGALHWLEAPLDWTVDDPRALDGIAAEIDALADEQAVDIVHVNLPSQAAGLRTGRPVLAVSHSCVVTWFAGVRGTDVPEDWVWQRRLNADGLRRADAVIVPSRSHGALVEATYGAMAHLTVVPNASRLATVLPEKVDMVFAAGRWWDEGKNGAVLDAAAPAMRWPLVMAGPTTGPDGQGVALRHADLRGALSHRETMELMTRSAIVVSPSLYEPFGLAALEAARSGAALVLADIPTYRELWGDAALFADPHDPEAFSDAVNRLADDPRLRRERILRAQAKARRFTPSAQADAMLGLYTRIASAKRSPDLAAAE